MKTYYLKTTDEQALWLALEAVSLATKDDDGEWQHTGPGALDIIGTIYEPTGNTLTDDEGNEYPETQSIEGFHANLLAEHGITGLPEVEFTTTNKDGETVTVNAPETPKRKFAGA